MERYLQDKRVAVNAFVNKYGADPMLDQQDIPPIEQQGTRPFRARRHFPLHTPPTLVVLNQEDHLLPTHNHYQRELIVASIAQLIPDNVAQLDRV